MSSGRFKSCFETSVGVKTLERFNEDHSMQSATHIFSAEINEMKKLELEIVEATKYDHVCSLQPSIVRL